jgi:hypothetical protein
MTVDVTPRRCQQFKPRPGARLRWTTSTGDSGTLTVDPSALVTVPRVVLKAGKRTTVAIGAAP